MLRVGFSAAPITPPLGKEIPGLFERRFAEGTHDPLFARAVMIDDGECAIAMVQCDAIFVSEDLVKRARKGAQKLCGVAGRNVLIAATHTHSGGPLFRGFLSEIDGEYERFAADQAASAVADAHRRLQPCAAGVIEGAAEGVAFNRRFIMRDGTQATHPGKGHPDIARPAGPEDPGVTVLAFRAAEGGRPLGAVVNFACHATHMNGLLYSADYPKYIVDALQGVYGPEFGVVFLNGACGDVTQVDNQRPGPMEFGAAWARRTGYAVGGEAVKLTALAACREDVRVDAASRRIRPAVRKADRDALAAARAYLSGEREAGTAVFDGAVFEAEAGAKQQGKTPVVDTEAIFSRSLLEVERFRKKCPALSLEVQGLRVGDALFWTAPGELFQAFALQVRERSPFVHTCCVELANGYGGYICTPGAFGYGYEPRTARSSLLVPEAGGMVVRAALSLARRLHKGAQEGGEDHGHSEA